MLVVKLGGSAVSNKELPFSYRRDRVVKLAMRLRGVREGLILVHGGGSFAHYAVLKYGVGNALGVSLVKESLLELKKLIVRDFASVGLPLYPVEPNDLVKYSDGVELLGRDVIERILRSGMIPLLHGDVVVTEEGPRIISGDEVVYLLAKEFRPRAVVFVMDVDGIYTCNPRFCREARKLDVIEAEGGEALEIVARGFDVTGGLRNKIFYGVKIAELGIDVMFCGVENFATSTCTKVSRTRA